ncbi:MAG: phenylalanine--tRNA ligase subunit alpha [Spirochaetes bacterium]|nr:phenylalanine--tRNA ligase subunit alpha [Spirochaetota bacterium]
MDATIQSIEQSARADIEKAATAAALEELRITYLGKKGRITDLLKQLGTLDNASRPVMGQKINALRDAVSSAITARKDALAETEFNAQMEKERIDVTLPGRRTVTGKLHILTTVEEEIVSVLNGMGFTPVEGPELEDEHHNFEALNIPSWHPARDSHDSFYVSDDRLLRTHTSPMQIRILEKLKPPLAVIAPGKTARRDAVDSKHSPVFHQLEGFFVDENVTFADLKGCLETFFKRLFGEKTAIRLRPDFFPFVEPGAEISATCVICKGAGCRTCGNTGWIELLGAGMIHPKVFEAVGHDPKRVSGFAFGMGIERIAMIKYGITDIRLFFENDLEFLRQF